MNEKIEFGKHYVLLNKKLNDHITAHNPHGVRKEDIGLGNLINAEQDKVATENSENYISSGAVFDVKEELLSKLNTKQNKIEMNPAEESNASALKIKIDGLVYDIGLGLIDDHISMVSKNAVQNRVIYNKFLEKQDVLEPGDNITIDGVRISAIIPELPIDDTISSLSENAVQNKVIYNALVAKQPIITSENKLNSDLVDDTTGTHKFVTTEKMLYWDSKSNFSGSYNDLTDKPVINFPVKDVLVNNGSVVLDGIAHVTVPVKTSDLINDTLVSVTALNSTLENYATNASLISYVKTSDLPDFDDFLTKSEADTYINERVPHNISQLNNDSHFIDESNLANTLVNYVSILDLNTTLESYASKQYVSDYHDNTKQDIISAGEGIIVENNIISTKVRLKEYTYEEPLELFFNDSIEELGSLEFGNYGSCFITFNDGRNSSCSVSFNLNNIKNQGVWVSALSADNEITKFKTYRVYLFKNSSGYLSMLVYTEEDNPVLESGETPEEHDTIVLLEKVYITNILWEENN